MANPTPEWVDLKNFNRQKMDLERFWVECVCCGGHIEGYDPLAVDRFLHNLERHSQWDMDRLSPVKLIRNASVSTVTGAVSAALAVCDFKYGLIGNSGDLLKNRLAYSAEMLYVGRPEIGELRFDDPNMISTKIIGSQSYSVPLNVIATFCFYSGTDQETFPLCNATIQWLRSCGHDVERSDSVPVCQMQMMVALQELHTRGIDPHEGYRMIWHNYHIDGGVGDPFAEMKMSSCD